jgi:hypothetical protein
MVPFSWATVSPCSVVRKLGSAMQPPSVFGDRIGEPPASSYARMSLFPTQAHLTA